MTMRALVISVALAGSVGLLAVLVPTTSSVAQTSGDGTISVKSGGDLQAALDAARPGDRIELEPGAVYRGPFRLPRKDGNEWIEISSAAREKLPSAGRRVEPSHAPLMPKLVSSGDTVIYTEAGAHHYRFTGLEIGPADDAFVTTLVQFGDGERTREALPHHLVIDHCYLHGSPTIGGRRGVALNSADTTVSDSYFADFKEVGADSQAIAGWNGPGPFTITGNYLEAAGENVMFGGADPTIPDLVPADIQVTRNHLAKPRRWMRGHPDYQGVNWAVKNLFELKNARRVRIEGNLLEYNWPHAQNGFAVLFTVRNQDGGAPWSTIEDVTFANNLVRHVAAGINILGHDDVHSSKQVSRVVIRNNLFVDVGGEWGSGRLFQLLDGAAAVTIEHNTALQTGGILFGGDHAPHTAFVYQNNIALNHEYPVSGSGTGTVDQALTRYFPDAVFRGNAIVGGDPARFPAGNVFPPSLAELGLSAQSGGLTQRPAVQAYARAGTDGRAPGANLEVLDAALRDVPSSGSALGVSVEKKAGRVIFWGAFVLLGYIYLGYPLLARIRARLQPHVRYRAPIEPRVTVIVVAHNEGDRISGRLANLLAQDYPQERLEIIVGSDGSTDDTVARARRYERFGVKVRSFAERRGKAAVLNQLIPASRGDIVVFADARQRFDRHAVRTLVTNFADPGTGAVSGELVLTSHPDTVTAGEGTAFYWRYEKFIRSTESRTGSTIGATGAIYAIRKELFDPIPDDTILDDVLIPLRIVRRGYRVLFDAKARAFDSVATTAHGEFVRKARTIAGTFQLFSRERWLFNPSSNRLWFETVSHKALRLAIPVLHISLLAATLTLTGDALYQWALAGQAGFYGCALAGYTQRHAQRRPVFLTVPYAMCMLGWATIVGFFRFATDRQQVTWERVVTAVPTRARNVDRAA